MRFCVDCRYWGVFMCLICMQSDPSITEYDSHTGGTLGDGAVSGIVAPDGAVLSSSSANETSASPVEDIADYLTDGYWEDRGSFAHQFDVETGGSISVDISGLDNTGRTYAVRALETWTAVSGLTFEYVTSDADITFDDESSGAYAQYWAYYSGITRNVEINISDNWDDLYGYDYYLRTYIHEIGHALGLGHAGDYNSSADYETDATFVNDSWDVSIMSYFDQTENTWLDGDKTYQVTPQIADIIAIQNLYGAPTTINTGDTVYGNDTSLAQYGMDLSGEYNVAIVDSDGFDTIDLSHIDEKNDVSLASGSSFDMGVSGGLLTIGPNTVIEAVITGSGQDTLMGNDADNYLYGGEGDDQIFGLGGDDTILAGGSDDVTGGAGADLFIIAADEGRSTQVEILDFSIADGDMIDVSWFFEDYVHFSGLEISYSNLVY